MNEEITVVIPTFNRAKTLPRTLNSLEKQTVKNFSCVIVDDGSTDGTGELVERLKETLSFPIDYYYKQNGGVLSARLYGFERARSDLIMNLDSDDEVTENAVEVLLKAWCKIPEDRRETYCGVLCLCRDSASGKIFGGVLPADINEISHKKYLKIIGRGERFGILRKSLLLEKYREYEPIKKAAGAKFVPEGTVNLKYDLENRFYCIHNVLRIYHTEDPDSICRNGLTRESCRVSYFTEIYILRTYFPDRRLPFSQHFGYAMYAIKFALLLGHSPAKVYRDVGSWSNRLVLTLAIPFGVGNFLLGRKIQKEEDMKC